MSESVLLRSLAVLTAVLALGAAARADVFNMSEGQTSLETVRVGNTGNTGEVSGASAGGWGTDRVCGAVDYVYSIGKYEVTAGQYCEFLNAVAAVDTYGLYNANMANIYGTQIIQTPGEHGYTYSVTSDWANRPVNYVSWADAARFVNWLHNGQPTGAQDLSTTEDGAYYLNGAMTVAEVMAVTRKTNWKWALPTEDEWYKAAFHENDGDTGNYHDYPTSSDSASNDLIDPDPGNNACFKEIVGGASDYTLGYPYMLTEAGEFENSESPYGTFDQGGNVWEWNEANFNDTQRGLRGGGWYGVAKYMTAAGRGGIDPTLENDYYDDDYFGFRVVSRAAQPGDANSDGKVDDLDASILAANWQRTGDAAWETADFNGDGDVDDLDASILAANWQYGVGGTAVPEPAAIALLLSALATVALSRESKRRRG